MADAPALSAGVGRLGVPAPSGGKFPVDLPTLYFSQISIEYHVSTSVKLLTICCSSKVRRTNVI